MEDDAAEIPISEMGGGLQWLVRSTPRVSDPPHPLTVHRHGFGFYKFL